MRDTIDTMNSVLIAPEYVNLDLKSTTQKDAILEVAQNLKHDPGMKNYDQFCTNLMERERTGSTYLTSGIALPHARTRGVDQILTAAGASKKGIQFDGQENLVYLIFVIATPIDQISGYLATVGVLARSLRSEETIEKLKNAESPEQFSQLITPQK